MEKFKTPWANTGRKQPLDISNMIYGKVPPQARDLEAAVLGAIMREKRSFETAADILRSETAFYVDAHQFIFGAMKRLSDRSQPIDELTVIEELRSHEQLDLVGGPYFITSLTNSVVSAAHIEYHARIVMQKFIQREMIRVCGETLSDAYEDATDAFELVEDHEKRLTEITLSTETKAMAPMDAELVRAVQELEVRRLNTSHITGTASGFADLDRITHGWQDTDLIILAARPSVGKTCFSLQLARNAATHPEKPKTVAFFSLEMSTGQLIQRLLSAESEIPLEKIATGRMDERDMEELYSTGIQRLAGRKIFFDDTPALNISQMRTKCRKLKRQHDVGLIIIDYLQLMSGLQEGKAATKSGNREQEVAHISRSLKALAKELQVPVIALSQMSREVEKRKSEDFMPKLSDLRESGAVEQDSDVVCFLYRPEYHGNLTNEMGESTSGETHLRIAKHRNGKLDTIKFTAKLDIQKFVPFEQTYNTVAVLPGNFKPIGTRASVQDDLAF